MGTTQLYHYNHGISRIKRHLETDHKMSFSVAKPDFAQNVHNKPKSSEIEPKVELARFKIGMRVICQRTQEKARQCPVVISNALLENQIQGID